MKLTRRQEEFVQKMIELRREFDGPVHYSLLAQRLGVSPFTAYDMLCLLEEKGYVTSAYQLPGDKSGPGRAERVFYPGEMALVHEQCIVEDPGGMSLEDDRLEQQVLERLRQGWLPQGEQALVEQLMARLMPAGEGDVRYCVEVITVAALRVQHSAGRQALMEHSEQLLLGESNTCRTNLCLLGGFVYGLLAQQSAPGQEWLFKLSEHLQGYVEAVMKMDRQDCASLAAQLSGVLAAWGEQP